MKYGKAFSIKVFLFELFKEKKKSEKIVLLCT